MTVEFAVATSYQLTHVNVLKVMSESLFDSALKVVLGDLGYSKDLDVRLQGGSCERHQSTRPPAQHATYSAHSEL